MPSVEILVMPFLIFGSLIHSNDLLFANLLLPRIWLLHRSSGKLLGFPVLIPRFLKLHNAVSEKIIQLSCFESNNTNAFYRLMLNNISTWHFTGVSFYTPLFLPCLLEADGEVALFINQVIYVDLRCLMGAFWLFCIKIDWVLDAVMTFWLFCTWLWKQGRKSTLV